MSVPMRAKMIIQSVDQTPVTGDVTSEQIRFSAVAKNEAYPDDGTDENNTFATWTPSASLEMSITNPALIGKYDVGDTFYVDFTPCE